MVVESDIETSRGAERIRRKLVELHERLLGATVSIDSPDVETAFQLFVETWEHKRYTEDWRDEDIACDVDDAWFFDGIADDVLQPNEDGDLEFDWERANEILDDTEPSSTRSTFTRRYADTLASRTPWGRNGSHSRTPRTSRSSNESLTPCGD